MKVKSLIPFIIFSLFVISCESKNDWINSYDPEADQAEISKICSKYGKECGVVDMDYKGVTYEMDCGKCSDGLECCNNTCRDIDKCEDDLHDDTSASDEDSKTDSENSTPDEDAGITEMPDQRDTEATDQDSCEISDDDGEEIVDTDTNDSEYRSPYGSLTFNFDNMIGSEGDPATSIEVFATGTYGNSTASIQSDFADKVETLSVVQGDNIYVQQTPVYADGNYGNPVVGFYIPVDKATPGEYTVNYNGGDASMAVFEIDWNTRSTVCYHAFGEGSVKISEANLNNMFKIITFSGNTTLYSPKNYKWNDISEAFLEKFTETNVICDPID